MIKEFYYYNIDREMDTFSESDEELERLANQLAKLRIKVADEDHTNSATSKSGT